MLYYLLAVLAVLQGRLHLLAHHEGVKLCARVLAVLQKRRLLAVVQLALVTVVTAFLQARLLHARLLMVTSVRHLGNTVPLMCVRHLGNTVKVIPVVVRHLRHAVRR